jgi:hypothetical protein
MTIEVIPFLYALLGLLSLQGYWPQVKSLLKAQERMTDISLKNWFLWTFSSMLTMLYGATYLHDWRICLVSGLGLWGGTLIIVLSMYNRFIRFPLTVPDTPPGTVRLVLVKG